MNIHTALQRGLSRPDKSGRTIKYRYIQPGDDIGIVTNMLHEAYAPLAARGMRFLATHQDSATTARRMGRGETILAIDNHAPVGIITLMDATHTEGCPFYDRPDVAGFGQFAVLPSHQRTGIGSTLLSLAEQRAAERCGTFLALDTSEGAEHLIALYASKGYAFVDYVQWPDVNYRSVVMAKPIV